MYGPSSDAEPSDDDDTPGGEVDEAVSESGWCTNNEVAILAAVKTHWTLQSDIMDGNIFHYFPFM